MINIVGSRLRYHFRIVFLGLHGIGMILGLTYKSNTPDLYPGSSHGKLGGVLTVLLVTHFIVDILRSFIRHSKRDKESDTDHELTPFISPESLEAEQDCNHTNQNSPPRDISPPPSRLKCPAEETHPETLFDIHLPYDSNLERRSWPNISEPHSVMRLLDISHGLILRFFPVLGFIAICTGIITMTGIFVRTVSLMC